MLIMLCNITEWISIGVDILMGGLVAFVLAYTVPKKLNDDWALKDFFIDEMRTLKKEYNDFCKNMCLGKITSSDITETFKQISMRIADVERCVNRELDIDVSIQSYVTDCQILVTNSDEINEMFRDSAVTFVRNTKNQISSKQDIFNRNIMSAIANINRANKKTK